MPSISRIRFCNVIYENGGKRYNDETFFFDGHNSAFLLENGGGKTVFIQTALQAIIPHTTMAQRKIKDTLSLENAPAHIAIEWIINDRPRRYAMTAVSLYIENNALNSLKYTYDYDAQDGQNIEAVPFSIPLSEGRSRPATRGEIADYYAKMNRGSAHANVFTTLQSYEKFIENTYKIIPSEWRKVATINSGEGNVDEFFAKCKTTEQLLSNLLIPVVEEAIEGDHTTGFVETFERQRNHFKKNRILQEKIEQSRLIKEEIDAYVAVFKDYHQEEENLRQLKGEAKTITNYVKNQLANKAGALDINEANQQQLKKDSRAYEQEQKSFDLCLLEEQLETLKQKQANHRQKLDAQSQRYEAMAARKQNIEITALGKALNDVENQLMHLRQELDGIDNTYEIKDVKQQLAENSSHIKGQFVYELALIEREIQRIDEGIGEAEENRRRLKANIHTAAAYEKDVIRERSQLEATIFLQAEEKERLTDQLFGQGARINLPLHEDSLTTKGQIILKDKSGCEKRLEELQHFITIKGKAKENLIEQKVTLKEQQTLAAQQLKQIEAAMTKRVAELERAGHPLPTDSTLYSKEASLLRTLEEQQAYALNQKEKALRKERINLRQFDLYEELSHFMSEPTLEPFVEKLKKEVAFIELGSQHMTHLKNSHKLTTEVLYNRYPLWSATVVTSVKDVDKVKAALREESPHLSQMVLVLTREEANQVALGQGELLGEMVGKAVFPRVWAEGLEPDAYYEWQQALRAMANDAMKERKEKEKAFAEATQLLQRLRDFFVQWPYDQYEDLKGAITSYDNGLKQVTADLQALDLGIQEDQDSLLKVSELLRELTVKHQALEGQLKLLHQLEAAGERADKTSASLDKIIKTQEEATETLEGYSHDLERNHEALEALEQERYRFIGEKEKILGLELYQEVCNAEPYGANIGLESLKEKRKVLKNRLAGLSRTRSQVEERIDASEKMRKRYLQEIKKMTHEAAYPVVVIEAYYEGEAEELYDRMVQEEKTIKALEATEHSMATTVTQIDTRCQMATEALERDFGGVVRFDIESHQIARRLKIEKATLSDRHRKLTKEKNTLESRIHTLEVTCRELEIKDGAHHFMGDDIKPLPLDVAYFDGFEEQAETVVRELLSSLEGQNALTKTALEKVHSKQAAAMDFCRDNITDRRLMETLATGLNTMTTYESLLIYQEKMTEIILKIIQVAEDDKRESDLELQAFLSHLMAYVKSVVTELNAIQNKTKITLSDQVKQIFVFDIPPLEEASKQGLRHYIDETIRYYEKESLQEEVTDEGLRRALTERLSVMRLLEVAMAGQPIKIKCRKVTNDMAIHKNPMIWESSNKWSGGEKWSKNMTLFLSILNYLAEKKQHLLPHQKRQRAVILDNPFGKASSDHVLKPVFMVAESLGFQIIALTAHAEGKFISDYFPVVYSCRLRATKDQTKQVMTSEKILNHTYLREKSPMTIMRMQEVEQIALF